LIGCKDKNIYVFFLDADNPLKIVGHNAAVNSISEIDDSRIIAGAWDGLLKIFDLNTF
jgi:hypothetical protein